MNSKAWIELVIKSTHVLLLLAILSSNSVRAKSPEPSFEAISRCFFVYGSIFEVGRDLPHAELFQFGQSRVGFVTGFFAANKSNAEFIRVFETKLAGNKRAASRYNESLKAAISARDQSQFSSVINAAVACDRDVGIRTDFVPKL